MNLKNEKYLKELEKRNLNISILGEYESANKRLLHKCNDCNFEWMALPNSVLYHDGRCPLCKYYEGKRIQMDTNIYRKIVSKYNEQIKVVGDYKGSTVSILHYCKIHDYKFNKTPTSVLSKSILNNTCICPICAKSKRTTKSYNEELKKIGVENIICVGEYKSNKHKTMHYCKLHDFYWNVIPRTVMREKECPMCRKTGMSKGEREIMNFLKQHNIRHDTEVSFPNLIGEGGLPLRYDFSIIAKNKVIALIEYDGEFHYGKARKGKRLLQNLVHDNIKSQYAKDNKIKLIRIPYWDFNKIEDILNLEFKKLKII